VPIGVAGELHIGGRGLARGYLNQPELTARKFIRNPFNNDSTARLYKTGDLARYLSDGTIQYLGRIDNQVKIQGHRVEPDEIESVLTQHPGVRECAVVAREETTEDHDVSRNLKPVLSLVEGSKTRPEPLQRTKNPKPERRLVAYVVVNPEQSPVVAELKNFLKQKLPSFMVPSVFTYVDALPRTPSGKMDRKALPTPDGINPESNETFAAPRTPDEEQMARIWAEILRVDRVGIHDNFFDLGGHSLLATQVISRVRKDFDVDLPLRSLFEAPTVAGMAATVLQKRWESINQHDLGELLSELESLPGHQA
jgi:acyl carrier protein